MKTKIRLVALTRSRCRVYLLSMDSTQTPTMLSWIDRSRLCEVNSEIKVTGNIVHVAMPEDEGKEIIIAGQ